MTEPVDLSPAPPSTQARIDVTVLLFSVLREAIGKSAFEVRVGLGATVSDLLDQLTQDYPVIHEHRTSLRVGVNAEYADEQRRLSSGDEIALITPVSGG